jgi:hypothetical protein
VSIGEKIADAIPESFIEFVHEHPKVLTAFTGLLVGVATILLYQACELDTLACQWRKARIGEIQRVSPEALGG